MRTVYKELSMVGYLGALSHRSVAINAPSQTMYLEEIKA
jgi:hypothetical protein